ncbi:MAG TPA: hypothetical protein VJZ71_03075 [Phycisphaerae bacterium]|nr:hypothetical protein [Phycisphaerae bacterium]
MEKEDEKTISQVLAPEDIRAGDYVSILHVLGEFLPLFFEQPWQPVEPIRVMLYPCSVQPMKVVEVCLPFVLVRKVNGKHETLDVRQHRLARVSKEFGRKAFKRFQVDAHSSARQK